MSTQHSEKRKKEKNELVVRRRRLCKIAEGFRLVAISKPRFHTFLQEEKKKSQLKGCLFPSCIVKTTTRR
jgi:hypothetical protein